MWGSILEVWVWIALALVGLVALFVTAVFIWSLASSLMQGVRESLRDVEGRAPGGCCLAGIGFIAVGILLLVLTAECG